MRRTTIEKWLHSNGWQPDKWGHYHKNKITVNDELKCARMKMQKSSIRYEIDAGDGEWDLITTDFYRYCKLNDDKLQICDLLVN